MQKKIAIVGTLDTKGQEVDFVQKLIRNRGHIPVVIDIGVLGETKVRAQISRNEVAEAGGSSLEKLIVKDDEAYAGNVMGTGLKKIVTKLVEEGKLHGLLAMGGGQGSINVAPTLKSLPLGFPKLLISTKVTQAGAAPYAGSRDVTLMPSVADIAGLNRLTRRILANGAGAIAGMVETEIPEDNEKPLVVMSMNGTVTEGALQVKDELESTGYEILVFHSIGTGGRSLEDYVSLYQVSAVIEFAVNELGNELFGGMASSGPDRFESAGRRGIPQIIIPGSADFLNFLDPSTVPDPLIKRPIHSHNPQATLVRTNSSENYKLGEVLAKKLNNAKGPVSVVWPMQGFSTIDSPGKCFYDPAADKSLYDALRKNLKETIQIIEVKTDINSSLFAREVVKVFNKITGHR